MKRFLLLLGELLFLFDSEFAEMRPFFFLSGKQQNTNTAIDRRSQFLCCVVVQGDKVGRDGFGVAQVVNFLCYGFKGLIQVVQRLIEPRFARLDSSHDARSVCVVVRAASAFTRWRGPLSFLREWLWNGKEIRTCPKIRRSAQ